MNKNYHKNDKTTGTGIYCVTGVKLKSKCRDRKKFFHFIPADLKEP